MGPVLHCLAPSQKRDLAKQMKLSKTVAVEQVRTYDKLKTPSAIHQG